MQSWRGETSENESLSLVPELQKGPEVKETSDRIIVNKEKLIGMSAEVTVTYSQLLTGSFCCCLSSGE